MEWPRKRLTTASGVPARFVRAEIYDWMAEAATRGARHDVVFASYGVVCWLPDLGRWARGIANLLQPSGRFVLDKLRST